MMNEVMPDNVIRTEEYFTILATEGDLSPKQEIQKNMYEEFIASVKKNPDLQTEAVGDVYGEFKKRLLALAMKETKTTLEQDAIDKFLAIETVEQENNEEMVRTLHTGKGGYVNATIILVMILNIGFIIAMALLGSK